MEKQFKEIIEQLVITWGISSIWWMSYYLYKVSQGKPFKITMFFIHCILAFYCWTVAWDFLPAGISSRNWILSIVWFLSYLILEVVETKWVNYLISYIKKWKN